MCDGTKRNGEACRLPAIENKDFCKYHLFSPLIVKVQCNAIANNRSRCKHFTTQGLKCHQHLDKFDHLKVRKSTLVGAKKGLFAAKPFARGEQIVEYSGPAVVSRDPEYGDDYTLQVKRNPPTFIDSRASNNEVGRYANARLRGRNQGANNAQFNYNNRIKKAFLRATKAIAPDQEITVPYGAQYWRRIAARN